MVMKLVIDSSIGRMFDCQSNYPCRVWFNLQTGWIFFRPPFYQAVMGNWSLYLCKVKSTRTVMSTYIT